jgi:hypothetical protein
MLTANADSHLQKYEKTKIGCENKTNNITGTITTGDTVIGDLLDHNMILIPIAIDPFGQFGPILQTFLFDTEPTNPITFTPIKPNATLMYHKMTRFLVLTILTCCLACWLIVVCFHAGSGALWRP